jgi:hypothetical protein
MKGAPSEHIHTMAWAISSGLPKRPMGWRPSANFFASGAPQRPSPIGVSITAGHTTCAVDERTTRHSGYEVSQRKRKRVEQSFGWMKTIGMPKKVKLRGIDKVARLFTFTEAAYNLRRLRSLKART